MMLSLAVALAALLHSAALASAQPSPSPYPVSPALQGCYDDCLAQYVGSLQRVCAFEQLAL